MKIFQARMSLIITDFQVDEGTPRLMLRAGWARIVMPRMEVQRKNTAAALAEKMIFITESQGSFYVSTVVGLP